MWQKKAPTVFQQLGHKTLATQSFADKCEALVYAKRYNDKFD